MCAQRFQQKRKPSYIDSELEKRGGSLTQKKEMTLRERVDQLNFNIQKFIDKKQEELEELEKEERKLMEQSNES